MHKKDFTGIRNNRPLPKPQEMEIPADIGDLLDDYVESTGSLLEELEAVALAYEAGDNRENNAGKARRVLHKIKGESGMVGIEEMADFCHQAEYAFDELADDDRPDMLLKFKDWACTAIQSMAQRMK